MDLEKINYYRSESRRIYNYLLTEFCSRFEWIKKYPRDESSSDYGLATVLMDHYITPQTINAIKSGMLTQNDFLDFFWLLEELLTGSDILLKDIICTTLIEKLSSEEDFQIDLFFPYCGSATRTAIYNSLLRFYKKQDRVKMLKSKYP